MNLLSNIIKVTLPLALFLISSCATRYPLPAGHRGDREAGADNSRRSIASAVLTHVPYIEIDLRFTKDSEIVLVHDKRIKNSLLKFSDVADGTEVKLLTLEQVRASESVEGGGTILTFSEALPLLKASTSQYLLDIKERDPALLAKIFEVSRQHQMQDRLILQCYSVEIAKYVRLHYPELPILARVDNAAEVKEYLKFNPEIVQIDAAWVSKDVVSAIHASGAKVLIKAVDLPYDNKDGWRNLSEKGADIVLTDYPRKLCEARGGC